MPTRKGEAVWEGNLIDGQGTVKFGGVFEGTYSFGSRFEEASGTNPEELIAAGHAACFSMAFSNGLATAGFTPTRVATSAKVHINKVDAGFKITGIDLSCAAEVPGIDEATFQEQAAAAKEGCPVSQALAAVEITLDAKLAT